jgi:hypothetical protein
MTGYAYDLTSGRKDYNLKYFKWPDVKCEFSVDFVNEEASVKRTLNNLSDGRTVKSCISFKEMLLWLNSEG